MLLLQLQMKNVDTAFSSSTSISYPFRSISSFLQLYNDRYFFIDSELATRTHAKAVKSPVYTYFYRYLPQDNFPFRKLKPGKKVFIYTDWSCLSKILYFVFDITYFVLKIEELIGKTHAIFLLTSIPAFDQEYFRLWTFCRRKWKFGVMDFCQYFITKTCSWKDKFSIKLFCVQWILFMFLKLSNNFRCISWIGR